MNRQTSFAAVALVWAGAALLVQADTPPTLPGPGFSADRYATLWTQSPFAIATPDGPAATQDYQLVGMAQFDGVSYVSLVDKQSNEHFVLGSDKPVKNLKLVSISHGTGGSGTAVILRNGETLTLQQEQAAAPVAANSPLAGPSNGVPIPVFPQVNPSVGGVRPVFFHRPLVRIHRPPVVVPPPPGSP
jgi:hypothetical protein